MKKLYNITGFCGNMSRPDFKAMLWNNTDIYRTAKCSTLYDVIEDNKEFNLSTSKIEKCYIYSFDSNLIRDETVQISTISIKNSNNSGIRFGPGSSKYDETGKDAGIEMLIYGDKQLIMNFNMWDNKFYVFNPNLDTDENIIDIQLLSNQKLYIISTTKALYSLSYNTENLSIKFDLIKKDNEKCIGISTINALYTSAYLAFESKLYYCEKFDISNIDKLVFQEYYKTNTDQKIINLNTYRNGNIHYFIIGTNSSTIITQYNLFSNMTISDIKISVCDGEAGELLLGAQNGLYKLDIGLSLIKINTLIESPDITEIYHRILNLEKAVKELLAK